MKFKAVIFDLDGTLLNSIGDIADAMNTVLSAQDLPELTEQQYMSCIGDGIEEFIVQALPDEKRTPEIIETCLNGMKSEYHRRWDRKTRPFDGIAALLDRLAAENIRLAVLSNKPDDFTKIIVEKILARWFFYPVRGALPGVPRKPDPTAALEIAQELKFSPSECVFVGDSEVDVETGLSAGMFAVAAAWGFRELKVLEAARPDLIIHHPLELLNGNRINGTAFR